MSSEIESQGVLKMKATAKMGRVPTCKANLRLLWRSCSAMSSPGQSEADVVEAAPSSDHQPLCTGFLLLTLDQLPRSKVVLACEQLISEEVQLAKGG